MKSIIIGNGINIQFGGSDYRNDSIIKRALHKIETGDFCPEVYTTEIGDWLKYLFHEFPYFIQGNYDQFAVASDERQELDNFKKRYNSKLHIYEIGFEDYFLLNELCCRKNKIGNPQRFDIQEILKRLFLDSIYNNGRINDIYKRFPKEFIDYISSFDSIFTTNYDRNIETCTKKDVQYLHGAFHVIDDLYNPNGIRNKLPDKPADKAFAIKGFEHAFSTALTSNSGFIKQFVAENAENTNTALEKFAAGIDNNPTIAKEIESWKNSDNHIIRNFYEAIKLKQKNPELRFPVVYAFRRLNEIKGNITFIGLSPYNDSHIFSSIRENKKIDSVKYYYFDETEKDLLASLLPSIMIDFISVKEFWEKITSP